MTTAALGGAGSAGTWMAAAHAQSTATGKPVILVLGDSLSAEYGLKRGEGWVPLLEKRLAQQKIAATVVNASISGDTSSGGRARFPALLTQHKPSHVVVELGANDALRGLPLSDTEANLLQITKAAQAAGAKVLIVGIQVPPNYGGDYTRRFEAVFSKVAGATKSALVPFLLKGVADAPNAMSLFQADRIHPTAVAQPQLLDNVWPELRKLLPK
ncbi:acyl-CoA thioesterase-1 [Variovorax boronicumulans]|uniref:Acyl-CoA thioesterase-1 n=2 Tax=Variovorax TaxID=34072 RepID=A0AAW8CU51_9BURK|nr:acyl-CoA thioesterase-1 [Variovorax boronicumulans]MDQ0040526.1 acyl-CoA thioesterase-1 [Variovorax boronicumulans]MDQ0051507.1 acyl-CoA thioesterase-1 [Variovorax boronicumulans]MDQ0070646.1 acyl-CoA thioesterase-1 [Variovorax boronicumulans]